MGAAGFSLMEQSTESKKDILPSPRGPAYLMGLDTSPSVTFWLSGLTDPNQNQPPNLKAASRQHPESRPTYEAVVRPLLALLPSEQHACLVQRQDRQDGHRWSMGQTAARYDGRAQVVVPIATDGKGTREK